MTSSAVPVSTGPAPAIQLPPQASELERADFARGLAILAALLVALPTPPEETASSDVASAP